LHLLGYGKIGKAIERVAKNNQHASDKAEIILRIDVDNAHELTVENYRKLT